MPRAKADRKLATADLLTPGSLARLLGVSAQTIRRLEAQGLRPLREPSGDRLYLPGAVVQARALLKRRLRRRRRRAQKAPKAAPDV